MEPGELDIVSAAERSTGDIDNQSDVVSALLSSLPNEGLPGRSRDTPASIPRPVIRRLSAEMGGREVLSGFRGAV